MSFQLVPIRLFDSALRSETFVTGIEMCTAPRPRCTTIAISCTSTQRSMMTTKKNVPDTCKPVIFKFLADYLDLSAATISIVLNDSPVADSIPAATKQRVHDAARKFDYRPNPHARMLRSRLTNTIGIIAPELSEGYFTGVMLGVEQYLLQAGFLYFTVSHLGRFDLKDEYHELLMSRRVDGFLLINTQLALDVPGPVVSISSHTSAPGVTNIMLDHNTAARMALRHLYDLGHRKIAFM